MKTLIRPALTLFLVLTLLTGLIYPGLVTLIGQAAFPDQAQGSLLRRDGRVVGSSLIGQSFASPRHFWGRPSATGPQPYNATASSGSNQGPLNPALVDAVRARVQALHDADPGNAQPVPADLVLASASGLDPHISPRDAEYQVPRVARERNLEIPVVLELVARHTENRQWGLFGEPRVNVLELNLALDALPH